MGFFIFVVWVWLYICGVGLLMFVLRVFYICSVGLIIYLWCGFVIFAVWVRKSPAIKGKMWKRRERNKTGSLRVNESRECSLRGNALQEKRLKRCDEVLIHPEARARAESRRGPPVIKKKLCWRGGRNATGSLGSESWKPTHFRKRSKTIRRGTYVSRSDTTRRVHTSKLKWCGVAAQASKSEEHFFFFGNNQKIRSSADIGEYTHQIFHPIKTIRIVTELGVLWPQVGVCPLPD